MRCSFRFARRVPGAFQRFATLRTVKHVVVVCVGAGDADACNTLGAMYESGQGAEQNYERAAALYKAACLAGGYRGCNNLGVM
jgi:TPR repeat protein